MAKSDLTTADGMKQWLLNSDFEQGRLVTNVERLSGGATGYVYRAHLPEQACKSVVVKHAEAYAARAQHFKLDQNRMVIVKQTE